MHLCAALIAPDSRAGQCADFDQAAADVVTAQVRAGTTLLHYCEPCEMQEPLPVRVRTLQVEAVTPAPHPVVIDGRRYSEAQIRAGELPDMLATERAFLLESIELANQPGYRLVINGIKRDLAYLYVPGTRDEFRNLGVMVRCADGVTPVLKFTLPLKDPATVAPPLPHFEEVTGHCYDGSCILDEWRVSRDAVLLGSTAGDAEPVAGIMAGERLRALRLLVEVQPVYARVVFDHGRFVEGDEFYILNSLGEGFHRVWYYGRVVEESLTGSSRYQAAARDKSRCVTPSTDCWAETGGYAEEKWWGYVQTSAGVSGWLRDPELYVENVLELQ